MSSYLRCQPLLRGVLLPAIGRTRSRSNASNTVPDGAPASVAGSVTVTVAKPGVTLQRSAVLAVAAARALTRSLSHSLAMRSAPVPPGGVTTRAGAGAAGSAGHAVP